MLQNRQQKTLFPEIIKTIGYDQIGILEDIMTLYCPQGFQCDPTYSVGNFYKSVIPDPIHKFDIEPQANGVQQASADNLPLESNSLMSIMFDPPFLIKSGDGSIMKKRFGAFRNKKELWDFYDRSLDEFHRILQPKGVIIFKCQDTVSGRKNIFSHVHICEYAEEHGYTAIDLFILLAKNRILCKHQIQEHARKFHSFFWVFQRL